MAWTPWGFLKADQKSYCYVCWMLILQIKEHWVYITVLLQGGKENVYHQNLLLKQNQTDFLTLDYHLIFI